jgi:membrane-bound inhibitor of C-type lysozyme
MKRTMMAIAVGFAMNAAFALPYQVTKEAEQISGGSIVSDPSASNSQAVTRTTDGIYTWWVNDTASMQPGSYSVYARVALASGVTGSRNFGLNVTYGGTNITSVNTSISHKAYKWVRVGGFDLTSVGAQLQIADWSNAGLSVDKMAVVKDISIEAESVAGSATTLINDASASGQRAVTMTSPGIYTWWFPATNDMRPGDYSVYASLASSDGAPHSFGEHLVLNEVDTSVVNVTVSATGYQWYKFNDLIYTGSGQSVRVADYSDAKLRVDRLKLVRATPYDEDSGLQSLFAGGDVALGDREQVIFRGVPNGVSQLQDPGRVSIIQANPTTVYAYIRQRIISNPETFEIYVAISSDGGKTFDVVNDPILTRAQTGLATLYDAAVLKRPDGYYMVFEGAGNNCSFASRAAYSADGLTNWQFRNTPVCTTSWDISASTPNYFVDAESGTQYLQWVNVDVPAAATNLYQTTVNSLWTGTLTFGTSNDMLAYAVPRSAPGQWDYANTGSGSVMYEDGYYYRVYEGANSYGCAAPAGGTSQWGLGIMRTNTPANRSTWSRSPKNPFLLAGKADSCWMQYPNLARVDGATYLYYNYTLPNWVPEPQSNTLSIFRHKLIQR